MDADQRDCREPVNRAALTGGLRRLAGCLAALAFLSSACSGQSIEESVQRLIERHKLESATIGYHIEDAATGMVLASRRSDEPMLPASNMKVFTSGAALAILGPDFAFRTTVLRDGSTITIVGDGDPALGDPEILQLSEPPLSIETMFDRLAQAVMAAGEAPISEVVVDPRVFDDQLVHPSWDLDDLDKHYAAPVSGLSIHTNNTYFFLAPDGTGGPPQASVQPSSPWIALTNEARTTSQGSNTAWLARGPGPDQFTLRGSIVRRNTWPLRTPMAEPARTTGRLLAHAVASQASHNEGIPRVRVLRDAGEEVSGTKAAVITTPLHEVLIRCNRDSQNLYAEALLKRLGHKVTGRPGSWQDGAAVVRMLVSERLGPEHAARVRVADGSGLSRDNRIAPSTQTAWLRSFLRDDALRAEMIGSLAVPGEGTFTRRFRGLDLKHDVRGKSGSLTGVRTLSGLVTHARTGRSIAFAVFVAQGDEGTVAVNGRDFADHVVGVIDRWLTEEESVGSFGG